LQVRDYITRIKQGTEASDDEVWHQEFDQPPILALRGDPQLFGGELLAGGQ
jgi:hypothetical protein